MSCTPVFELTVLLNSCGDTNAVLSQVTVPIDDLSLSERMHRMLEPDQLQRLRKVTSGWGMG